MKSVGLSPRVLPLIFNSYCTFDVYILYFRFYRRNASSTLLSAILLLSYLFPIQEEHYAVFTTSSGILWSCERGTVSILWYSIRSYPWINRNTSNLLDILLCRVSVVI